MSRIKCPWCDREKATQDDWDNLKAGEGENLCWIDDSDPSCSDESVMDLVTRLRAELEEAKQHKREYLFKSVEDFERTLGEKLSEGAKIAWDIARLVKVGDAMSEEG